VKQKHIETIIVICAFLLILARINKSWSFVYAAVGLLILGFTWRRFRENLHWLWMKLAEAMGFVSGKILLTVVFVFVVIPLSFFARLRGKLNIKLKPVGNSYFKLRNHTFTKDDLQNPW
jgi:Saxitoxin biosynthesis operon protein SxtJ